MNDIYKNIVLPRLIFLPYFALYLLLIPLYLIILPLRSRTNKSRLCIESGIKGWELLEYKELYQTAVEYLSEGQVVKISIDKSKSYILQILNAVKEYRPSHYFYDPRTVEKGSIESLLQSSTINLIFLLYGVTPIVLLTDSSVRLWRLKAAIVSQYDGIVINFMHPSLISPIFPHSRIYGPFLMPLSIKTLENLNLEIEKNKRESKAVFVGSLYEPRTTILNQIKNELQKNNFDLEIKARVLGGPRISDEEYWKQIYNSSIVVTTVDQVEADGFDWSWNKQLVYRFLEATASGTLLLAPYVKGSERYFKANIDYHLYSSIEEAVEKISYFLSNPSILHEVSLSGKNKAETLIRAKTYWMQIDNALGKKGFQI